MQTSGLILDMHDDQKGEIVRAIYPSFADVPETVKTAQMLGREDLDGLPDDVFALVLRQGDVTLRKYACIDEGNTVLNIEYLLKTAQLLPIEAAKLAANNLLVACDWYAIEPPEELKKLAFWGALGGVAMKGLGLLGTAQKVIGGTKAAVEAGKGLTNTSSAIQGLGKVATVKQADLSFTETMPAASSSQRNPQPKKAVITKTGTANQQFGKQEMGPHAVGHLVPRHQGDANYPKVNAPVSKAEPIRSEQDWDFQLTEGQPAGRQFVGRVMSPNIEVRSKTGPDRPVYEKKASKYALDGRYPLDNIQQIKRAAAWFDEYGVRLQPADRHQYCVNMVKAASSVGVSVSDEAARYGSVRYAPASEVKVAMDVRKAAITDARYCEILDRLSEKRATISPDVFCQALEHFDRMTGLHHYYDSYVPDPYWSTYGMDKQAEFMETIGNDSVTEQQLKDLVGPGSSTGDGYALLHKTFGEDFAEEFHKDPIGIFKSLPIDQKRYIMRLATDNGPSGMSS
jgi:hypothetical protein